MNVQQLTFIAVIVISIAGCNNKQHGSASGQLNDSSAVANPVNGQNADGEKQLKGNWEKLNVHQFRDGSGNVISEIPLPAAWKRNTNHKKGEPTFIGPHGLKVTDYSGQNFMYVTDQRLQQSYYQSGQQMRAMPGIEQLIQQDIVPQCAANGLEFVRYYEIPEVTKTDKWYNDQLYKAVPGNTEIAAIGTDWKTASGDPYFLLIHLTVSTTAQMQLWNYWCTGLEAEKTFFPLAKKQLLFGLANTYYPLEPIMAYNQREAEKAGQSWAAHNQRMAQNQARFESSQRAFVNRSNAINDAIMSGWRERNAASDKQQEQFIDAINERTNVVDPNTGKQYKVSSGSNQYWMNSNGEYIGTDHVDYNPNLDENMNNEKWQELNQVK
jgi:hypothetical protein